MKDQSNQRQIDEMKRFGCHRVYYDTGSGRNMRRPGWEACWKDLREQDLLVLHAIDRLGRDLLEVVRTVRDLHEKGANLKVLSMDIDTRTSTGKLMLGILASMAEWERDLIMERTLHGLAKARERGVKGGAQRIHSSATILAAAREYGVTNAHAKLDPPLSKGGFMKALKRAQEEREARRLKRVETRN